MRAHGFARVRQAAKRPFPTSERKRQLSLGSLKPEDLLDLVPDGQQEEHGQPGEDGEREVEAKPCMSFLAPAPNPRVSASAVIVVGAVDRLGVDRRFFRWPHNVSSGWLGHSGSLLRVTARPF
jgi:hypothetical protein